MIRLIWVALVVTLISCGPQKRYDRLVERHPWLVETDTVVVKDTITTEKEILVPEYKDSFILQHDTIIETEKVIIKKYKDVFHVTVKQDTISFRDTIYREVKVAGKTLNIKETNWLYIFLSFVAGIITIIFVSKKI
jgi:hypothetical protein